MRADLRNRKFRNVHKMRVTCIGLLPGDELPPAVYRTVISAFALMMLAAWQAFWREPVPYR